jgi:protocatechuate 3,4-dioxygenase beta subunit
MKSLLLFPFLAASLVAQTFVDGHVLDSITGAPVSGAYIVWGGVAGEPVPLSDSSGHFRMACPNNACSVLVKHNGYLDSYRNVTIEAGQAPAEVRVQLVPQAAISGHVFDENGLPVRGAQVAALLYREENGQRRLRPWRGSSETNELGEYRIFDLPAGRYYLGFTPGRLAEWDPRYSARLYPDETEVDRAAPVDVRAGEERGGRDFRLSRREGVTIAGHVVTPAGRSVSYLFLQSVEYFDFSVPVTLLGDSFTIAHVPPGNYRLSTWRDTLRPSLGDVMGGLTLRVGTADIRDVSLDIRPIAEQDVAGTIAFLGRTKPGPMTVTLRGDTGTNQSVVSNADGSFVFKGVLPGRYLVDARSAAVDGVPATDGHAIAVQFGGHDVSWQFDLGAEPAGALKISVAAPVANLTGKLLDAGGRPVSGARILFLPSVDNMRSSGYTKEDGSFTASFLTSGEHRIYVVSADAGQFDYFRDPNFLQSHRNDFPPVQVVEGMNAPLILRVPAQ